MKFKVLTQDWTTALALVSSITPTSIDARGSSGYLCVVRGEHCYLYSEDGHQRFRVPIPVFDVEGEGAFVFPTGPQGDLRYVEGWVEFESGEEGGADVVWCRRDTGGAKGGVHKIITFTAKALKALDADFSNAKKVATFPSVLLKEALNMTRPYLAEPKDALAKPEFLNVQLFGADEADGNGYMLGHSTSRTSYFYSPELEGKPLFVYGTRIPLLLSFLSKSPGTIDVYNSENSTYFMNSTEQVLGWSNQDYAGSKYGYYGLALDNHIFRIGRASLEKELKYVRSTLPADKNKAFVRYDHTTCLLTVVASNTLGGEIESLPLAVTPLVEGEPGCWGSGSLSKTEDVQFHINLDWMIQLVEATKHPRDVMLGIAQVKKSKQHLFRVIEDYFIDESGKYVEKPAVDQKGYACRAMRYVPSKQ
jgi:hypothetical protein